MPKKKQDKKQLIITVIVVAATVLIGQFVGLAVVVWLAGYLLGMWLGKSLAKKLKGKETGFTKFLAWANVAAWLIPPLGFLTGGAVLELAKTLKGQRKKTYQLLAGIGMVMATLNGIVGVAIQLSN